MKIIIFGGSGFLGTHLVGALLKKSQDILVCDMEKTSLTSQVMFHKIDVRNKKDVDDIPYEKNDIIINLAANQYHHRVPKKNRADFFSKTNTEGTRNILEAAFKHGCTNVIQFSTDMVYGKPKYLPVDTNHPQNPFGPYGMSKKAAEEICRDYRRKGMNITIFRPRMIIGPGRLGILKKLFSLINYSLPIPTIGNGRNCYQMISVFDCVSAILLAIEKGFPNKEYNLGSNNPPQTKMLLKELIKTVQSKTIVVSTYGPLVKGVLAILGRLGMEIMYKEQYMIADENYILDISETKKDLGWVPQFTDQDMIIESYATWKAK